MKTLLVVSAALFVAAAVAGVRSGSAGQDVRKATVCHKTSSAKKPYTRVVAIGAKSIVAHQKHAADIIPAPASCPQTLLTPTSGGTAITLNLRGVNEQPDPADADGAGTAELHLRAGQAQVCYSLTASNVTLPAAGAHIHRGNVDASGDIAVQLTAPGASGTSSGCTRVTRQLVADLLANPSSYYVNVHTTDFPNGAIRAQLARPANAVLVVANMAGGANEKPNPGDPDGTGLSQWLLFPDTGRVCWTMAVTNITLPTAAAHIHRGGADVAGPVVVPIQGPGATGTSAGCVTSTTALVAEIAGNPAGFYANAHTRDFPGGAVRGQLAAAQ